MDNTDVLLRKRQRESFINLDFHIDRCKGVHVTRTLIVNELNQDI